MDAVDKVNQCSSLHKLFAAGSSFELFFLSIKFITTSPYLMFGYLIFSFSFF